MTVWITQTRSRRLDGAGPICLFILALRHNSEGGATLLAELTVFTDLAGPQLVLRALSAWAIAAFKSSSSSQPAGQSLVSRLACSRALAISPLST